MDRLLLLILGVVGSVCRSRADLVLENAVLRHQLGVLMRAGRRPRVTAFGAGIAGIQSRQDREPWPLSQQA